MTRLPPACDRAAEAILAGASLDEHQRAHLAGCAACRTLAAAHAGAARLHPGTDAAGESVGEAEVRTTVRRRRVVRRSLGLAALVAAAAGALFLRPEPARTVPGPSILAAVADAEAWTRSDPVTSDAAYAAFGPLPSWLAPRRGTAGNGSVWPEARLPWEGRSEEVTP